MNEDIFHLGIKTLIRNNEGKYLLLKVNPRALKKFNAEPYWDIPGGRIHRGSKIKETLKREVEEETGINRIRKIVPFSMVLSNIRIPVDNSDVGLVLGAYICEVDNVGQVRLSSEHTDFGWFSGKEMIKLLKIKYPKEFTDKLLELK